MDGRYTEAESAAALSRLLNRFKKGNRSYPVKSGHNLNRSSVLRPPGVRGGVLLLHGMTDSPYTLRHLATMFKRQGLYVLNLRLPGHGTIPAERDRVRWQDWYAAAKLGVDPIARFSRLFNVLGYLEYFRQTPRLEICPEYDPHKYDSFPVQNTRGWAGFICRVRVVHRSCRPCFCKDCAAILFTVTSKNG